MLSFCFTSLPFASVYFRYVLSINCYGSSSTLVLPMYAPITCISVVSIGVGGEEHVIIGASNILDVNFNFPFRSLLPPTLRHILPGTRDPTKSQNETLNEQTTDNSILTNIYLQTRTRKVSGFLAMKSPHTLSLSLRLSTTVLVLLSAGGFLLTSGTPLNPHAHLQTHSRPHSTSYATMDHTKLARRDTEIVYNPPITSPTKDTTITAGRPFYVTWSTKGVPGEKRNSNVNVVLGHGRGKNEHLDVARPLAEGVSIMTGKARVVLSQDTPSRGDYFVVGESRITFCVFAILKADGICTLK